MSMSGRVIEYAIRARDGVTATVSKVRQSLATVPAGAKPAAVATKELDTAERDLAKGADLASGAMRGATDVGLGMRQVFNGGAESIGGMIRAIKGLAQGIVGLDVGKLAKMEGGFTALGGGILAAAGAGWKLGKMLDESLKISDGIAARVVPQITYGVARARAEFEKLNQVKLTALKKELAGIAEEVNQLTGDIDRTAKAQASLTQKRAEKEVALLELTEAPGAARDRKVALIRQAAAAEATNIQERQAQLQRDVLVNASRDSERKLAELSRRRIGLRGNAEQAALDFSTNESDANRVRMKEARRARDVFEEAFGPEITNLEKQVADVAAKLQEADLAIAEATLDRATQTARSAKENLDIEVKAQEDLIARWVSYAEQMGRGLNRAEEAMFKGQWGELQQRMRLVAPGGATFADPLLGAAGKDVSGQSILQQIADNTRGFGDAMKQLLQMK